MTVLRQKLRVRMSTASAASHDWSARSTGHLACVLALRVRVATVVRYNDACSGWNREARNTPHARYAESRRRSGSKRTTNQVRTGALPWQNIDVLHRLILDRLLAQSEIQ
jgi:hypothetical protein